MAEDNVELEALRKLAAFVEEEFEGASDRWGVEAGHRHLATDPEDGPSTGEEGYIIVDVDDNGYLAWTPLKGSAEILVEQHNELVEALEQMRAIVEEARRPAGREAMVKLGAIPGATPTPAKAPRPRRQHWNVWSKHPARDAWMVVESNLPEAAAKVGALRRTAAARRLGMEDATFVALPAGQTPHDAAEGEASDGR